VNRRQPPIIVAQNGASAVPLALDFALSSKHLLLEIESSRCRKAMEGGDSKALRFHLDAAKALLAGGGL
jgi:hypothetical protein